MDAEFETLFEKWKNDPFHSRTNFISDGIIEPIEWEKQSPKILFLLKEAYTNGGDGFDLREELSDNAPYRCWWQASQWIYGILEMNKTQLIPKFPEILDRGNKEEANNYIKKIAVVNLKKSNGKTLSNNQDLASYVDHDKDMLKQQIDLINPDIILCGNVFPFYKSIYDSENIIEIPDTNAWCFIHKNRFVISAYHIANPSSRRDNFSELFQKLFQAKMWNKLSK